jgi:deoxyribodipyrimidine photo-lyase
MGPSDVRTAIVLFTRDLRVHDHPPLATAAREVDRVVPLFVLDHGILKTDFARPNRIAFLRESLKDLDDSLAKRGARLVLRSGDVVTETMRLARDVDADTILVSADASGYAQERERRLERRCAEARVQLRVIPEVTSVVDDVTTKAGSHFSVFTPYYRAWRQAPLRRIEKAPRRLAIAADVNPGRLPALHRLVSGPTCPELPRGGETAARRRLAAWIRSGGLGRYEDCHDDMAADATSRLSAYLHFGCLSPREMVERVAGTRGSETFVRQLAWRDFFCQLLEAQPETSRENMRDRGDRWHDDAEGLAAWKEGRTGYPIVDAGMRQLLREGFMHNRARLITASFLTKDLYLDWRHGAAHYFEWLVDGDVANNVGNWQWVAGTGADTRPNRTFNPIRQAKRFDPVGAYVRRYVPELGAIEGPGVHEPWKLRAEIRAKLDYPDPIVDHDEAAARLRRHRQA